MVTAGHIAGRNYSIKMKRFFFPFLHLGGKNNYLKREQESTLWVGNSVTAKSKERVSPNVLKEGGEMQHTTYTQA